MKLVAQSKHVQHTYIVKCDSSTGNSGRVIKGDILPDGKDSSLYTFYAVLKDLDFILADDAPA